MEVKEMKEKERQEGLNNSCIDEVPSNQLNDINKPREITSDMMDCDVMSELEPAQDDDMSCDESSTKDRLEGYTMKRINNVQRVQFGGHWLIFGAMHKGGKY
eukprot:4780038-Ditylum_brightwellii.AAC.1